MSNLAEAERTDEATISIKGIPGGVHIKANVDWVLKESMESGKKIAGIANILRDLATRIEKGG